MAMGTGPDQRESRDPTPPEGDAPRHEQGPLSWRWAVVTAAAFAGVFVGPSIGAPALETASIVVLIVCVLLAMGMFGARRER
jgi:hypothetical protein